VTPQRKQSLKNGSMTELARYAPRGLMKSEEQAASVAVAVPFEVPRAVPSLRPSTRTRSAPRGGSL